MRISSAKYCWDCRTMIRGFNYGLPMRPQCESCYKKEQDYYAQRRINELEEEKLQLEIELLKKKLK